MIMGSTKSWTKKNSYEMMKKKPLGREGKGREVKGSTKLEKKKLI